MTLASSLNVWLNLWHRTPPWKAVAAAERSFAALQL